MLNCHPHAAFASLVLMSALLCAACEREGCQSAQHQAPAVVAVDKGVRRIVLISIDTLRADHLGTYGHTRRTSPNLDELAAHGAVFEDASSTAPWTLPAHSSMLTGFYPKRTLARTTRDTLAADVPTIAEALRSAGYRTSGFVNVIWLRPIRGLNRGFETWKFVPEDETSSGAARLITDLGIEFLEESGSERSFLFLHYFDLHSPYLSEPEVEQEFLPEDFRKNSRVTGGTVQLGLASAKHGYLFSEEQRQQVEKLYDAGILQLDRELGRLFRFIDERFGFDDTLVIVTSDHGEGFFEHGTFSHGQNQYQEQLHVPLILRGGRVPSGARVGEPVSIIDIAPTILAATGVDTKTRLPGFELSDYWLSPAPARSQRAIYSQSAPGTGKDVIRMVRRGRTKLISHLETRERELYDLVTDPTEKVDLSKARPDLVEDLSSLMDQFFDSSDEEQSNPLKLDPETVERLRSLGYVE